jgi:Mrp family chromosome partitioning ATPase
VPVPKPARRPQRTVTQLGIAPPDPGAALPQSVRPPEVTSSPPISREREESASMPDLPDADTVVREVNDLAIFTPPDIPLALAEAPSPPPSPLARADEPTVHDARVVEVVPPPAAMVVRVPPAAFSLDAVTTSTALAHPRPDAPPDPRLVLLHDPDSRRAASFRLLRDNLIANKLPRVLAISSAEPNEGKTTCAINLALALAEQPATRVLLIDGNFFDPTLASVFSIDERTQAAPEGDAPWLRPYRIAPAAGARGLLVAAIVRRRGDPAPRFDSHWFDTLIGHLCGSSFDYLVIDAPALRGSPSVVQLVSIADATLLTVRAGTTTARALRQAADQIPKSKALGVALIDSPSDKDR